MIARIAAQRGVEGAGLGVNSDEDVLATLVVERAAIEVAVERLELEAGDVE